MKNYSVRKDYLLVSVAVLVFTLSAAFSLFKINRASVTLADQYPLAIWTIELLEHEYLKLVHALELHVAGQDNQEQVLDRFDILWNRVSVVIDGREAALARKALGAHELSAKVLHTLKQYDEMVQNLSGGANREIAAEVLYALEVYRDPIHEMIIRGFHDRNSVYGLNLLSDNLHAASIAFIGLVLSGLVLVVMLIRQFRTSRYQANHDVLTKLANRRHFMDQIQKMILRAERYNEGFAVYLIDLNDFKPINDKHGHLFGDQVLRVFGQRLKNSVRQMDVASRLGGDEFAVIQYPVKESNEILAMSHRLKQGLAGPVTNKGITIDITHSMGVATYPTDGDNAEELLHAADMKMYGEKKLKKQRLQNKYGHLQTEC